MRRPLFSALALAAALSATPALAASVSGPYTSLWVFGDSLSDSGNVYALTDAATPGTAGDGYPPSPYWQGRFSNGKTYAEDLAAKLGFTATPSLLGGKNFAYGGATASSAAATGPVPVPGLEAQVTSFVNLPGTADSQGLYVLWAGANDMRANPSATGITAAMKGLSGAIQDLYTEGARNFLVMNLPDLGLTPEATIQGATFAAAATAGSAVFNSYFAANIAGLGAALTGSSFHSLDTFALLNKVAANPGSYGLNNVGDSCINLGAACTVDSPYLFWDGIHPTAVGHSIIANAAYGVLAVPEPETYAMFLAGLGILGAVARRRRGA
jgi:phospholipase/lecithinase/hemolysin